MTISFAQRVTQQTQGASRVIRPNRTPSLLDQSNLPALTARSDVVTKVCPRNLQYSNRSGKGPGVEFKKEEHDAEGGRESYMHSPS